VAAQARRLPSLPVADTQNQPIEPHDALPAVGSPRTRSDTTFAVAVTCVFAVVCGVVMYHHEMWRDEMQSWLIARDSADVGALIRNIRYERHPSLWFLLLYCLTGVTQRAEAMQALHLAVASGCAFLFAKFAPFPRWAKALFVFGYFPLYEYGVIARNYSLGVFFLFAAAAAFPRRHEHPWRLGAALVLAAHTSMHALLVAGAITAVVAVEPFVGKGSRDRMSTAARTVGIAFVGMAAAIAQLRAPADIGYTEEWATEWNRIAAERVLGFFASVMLPLPSESSIWGTSWLSTISHHAAPVLSICLLVGIAAWLLERRTVLVGFLAGNAALFAFFYLQHTGSLRHHGFLLINAVLALWLARAPAPHSCETGNTRSKTTIAHPALTCLIAAALIVQVLTTAIAVREDVLNVFSAGRATAELVQERGLDDLPLVGDDDTTMASVVGYLGASAMYYPRSKRFGSYTIWDKARSDLVPDAIVFDAARALARERDSNVVVVLDRVAARGDAAGAVKIGCRIAKVVPLESFCVYEVPAP
jgi:hypothetical protein